MKRFQIRSFPWSVFSRIRTIQSECGKKRTRKNSVFGHAVQAIKDSELNRFSLMVVNEMFTKWPFKKANKKV